MGGRQVIFLPNQLIIEETGDNMAVSLQNQLVGEEVGDNPAEFLPNQLVIEETGDNPAEFLPNQLVIEETGDNPAEFLPNQLVGEEVGDKQVVFLLKCPRGRGRVEKVKNPGANQASFSKRCRMVAELESLRSVFSESFQESGDEAKTPVKWA